MGIWIELALGTSVVFLGFTLFRLIGYVQEMREELNTLETLLQITSRLDISAQQVILSRIDKLEDLVNKKPRVH
jgi:hypothetical protein